MGTPVYSVPTLNALLTTDHSVVAVYTQPPKARDRGHSICNTPIHDVALQHNIPVFTPKSLRSTEEQDLFKSLDADLAVVIAYGLILPKAILDAPQLGCVNLHASLLPRWRGAAPIQRAIMARDPQSGVTLMQMDEGLDTGDMLAEWVIPLAQTITAPILHDQLANVSATLLMHHLDALEHQTVQPRHQPTEGVCYAHKLEKHEGELSWHQSAVHTDACIRALNPWPGTWVMIDGVPIKIIKACPVEGNTDKTPGTFFSTDTDPLCVSCGDGTILALGTLQKPGGKPLNAGDFLRGYQPLNAIVQRF